MSGSMEGTLPGMPDLPPEQEPGDTIELGPKFLDSVTFNDINELPQIRRRYDQEELEELADSMCHIDENGNVTFDLYNPPVIAKLTTEEAWQYVEGHGRLFPESGDTQQKFDSLTLAADGYYYIIFSSPDTAANERFKSPLTSMTLPLIMCQLSPASAKAFHLRRPYLFNSARTKASGQIQRMSRGKFAITTPISRPST